MDFLATHHDVFQLDAVEATSSSSPTSTTRLSSRFNGWRDRSGSGGEPKESDQDSLGFSSATFAFVSVFYEDLDAGQCVFVNYCSQQVAPAFLWVWISRLAPLLGG
jgi:hypothetical protein